MRIWGYPYNKLTHNGTEGARSVRTSNMIGEDKEFQLNPTQARRKGARGELDHDRVSEPQQEVGWVIDGYMCFMHL